MEDIRVVEEYSAKDLTRDFASVFVGIISGILTYLLVTLLLFATGMIMWTDGGSQEEIKKMEMNVQISFIIMAVVSGFVAGVVTAAIASSRSILPSIITAVILIVAALLIFGGSAYRISDLLVLTLILPFSITGALVILWRRKQKSSQITRASTNTPQVPS